MKKIIFSLLMLPGSFLFAQSTQPVQYSLLFGLTQPTVLQGFNFEVDVWTTRWVFDYSHGFGLQFRDGLVTGEAAAQQLAFYVPHSTGIGIGYRFTEGFNLRVEPKWHIWQVYEANNYRIAGSEVAEYSTFTLGLGAYYRWLPFEKQNSALRGITLAPSVRWWPNVGSTLNNNEISYFNTSTGRNELHRANNIGMANSPFFVNVSLGYTF